jgi:hypothetical protein
VSVVCLIAPVCQQPEISSANDLLNRRLPVGRPTLNALVGPREKSHLPFPRFIDLGHVDDEESLCRGPGSQFAHQWECR